MAIAEDHIRRAVDSVRVTHYAFYSEILFASNYERAEQMLRQALEYGVTSSEHLFDVYRVQGMCLSRMDNTAVRLTHSTGRWSIHQYDLSANRIGVNWRQLKGYTQALEMFSRAAHHDQLGIKDPLYLAIAQHLFPDW